MGELSELLPFLIVLWLLFGGLFGKKKGKGSAQRTPPGPPQRQRPRPGSPPARARTKAGGAGDDGSAADMLPDDLWAVLTGERRPQPPVPAPREEAEYEPVGYERDRSREEPEFDWGPGRDDEAADWRRYAEDEAYSLEDNDSGEDGRSLEVLPVRPEPVVVSLEVPPPPPDVRHTAFHRRLAQSAAKPPMRIARRRVRLPIGTRDELRRAMVLREVLGPPRGLE